MTDYHKLLLRQLKRSNIDIHHIPDEFKQLLSKVSNAYTEAEQGLYIIERAMEISSGEMRELRDKLKKEKDIIQSVMSDGLCVIDPLCKISNLNSTAANLLCHTVEECNNQYFNDIFTLYDVQNEKEINFKTLLKEHNEKFSYHCNNGYLKTKNGIIRQISFSINPLPLTKNKEFGGAVIIFSDISERIEREQLLVTSLKAAQESNRAKTQFLANMSHEIRTPMNGILGMLQLLIHSPLDDKQIDYAKKCLDSANSLLRVIGDILDISKIEAGKVEFEEIAFNLKHELDSLIIVFSTICKEKSLHINLHYDDNIPTHIKGDVFRLKQVISNIVNNAIKFTPAGGIIEIAVKALKIERSFVSLAISISDTGIGIAPEMQTKIFDVFSQADETTTRNYGGTGLGLPICKHLVELMGGYISVKSDINQGSTFSFTLKFGIPEIQSDTFETSNIIIDQLPQFNAKILLVEDNSVNQIVINDMLKILGCNIDIAPTGKHAFDAVLQEDYDLIFMDCNIPDIDGFQVTKKIREHEKTNDSDKKIIVALTANTLKGTKEKCLDAGMDDYLSKPVTYSQLCTTLLKHLR